ncbi:hypothetical protein ANCCAN_18259 [Ancylostoma caninum]|uniref:Major facilitator superfamily (MFS) profile domain-containing protein n=1 Tax=Ancylostoma caninum TaxID=29170 RepID=A0A368FWK4_ANCCA|nr:hypothetical protein ANCCAN_18259 [Ancylostoma caninum]
MMGSIRSDRVAPKRTDILETNSVQIAEQQKGISFDEFLVHHLGHFGRYQFMQLLLVWLPSVFVAMHVMSWTFAALPAEKSSEMRKPQSEVWGNMPTKAVWSSSAIGECANTTGNYTCATVGYSASDRWNIKGSRSWIKGTVQSLYYVGHMIGSFFCGIMSDKIGRKKVLFIAIVIQIICGALLTVAPTWWLFAILKAGTGLSHPGVYAIAIVLGTEVVGAHYRRIVAVGAATAVAIGEARLLETSYLFWL